MGLTFGLALVCAAGTQAPLHDIELADQGDHLVGSGGVLAPLGGLDELAPHMRALRTSGSVGAGPGNRPVFAQKSTSTTLPRNSSRLRSRPSRSGSPNSTGADAAAGDS